MFSRLLTSRTGAKRMNPNQARRKGVCRACGAHGRQPLSGDTKGEEGGKIKKKKNKRRGEKRSWKGKKEEERRKERRDKEEERKKGGKENKKERQGNWKQSPRERGGGIPMKKYKRELDCRQKGKFLGKKTFTWSVKGLAPLDPCIYAYTGIQEWACKWGSQT